MPRPQVPSVQSRLDSFHQYTGKGVVMAFVDSGFYPHGDLMRPVRRIKAYADATQDVPNGHDFFNAQPFAWHGTMTACTAAGNGYLSGGHYRGLASDAEVVLIKAGLDGRIMGKNVAHAIRFPLRYPELNIQILNVSLGVDHDDPDRHDVEVAVEELVASGVTVFAAAGNRPDQKPEPPGSSPHAITVGGENDLKRGESPSALYPFSHGSDLPGVQKPDLLAPACWVPAPMLPGTLTAREADPLFQLLSVLEEASTEHGFSQTHHLSTQPERDSVSALMKAVAKRIEFQKYLSPAYQHVDGTSFASPIAASVAAQMLEVDASLSPSEIREGLIATAEPLEGIEPTLQGAGLLRPRRAVEWALERVAARPPAKTEPEVDTD